MAGIAFFDIDGTLTYGISSGAFIADRLGTGDRMRDAEDRYARGEIGNDTVCDIDARGYTGHRVSEIHGWLNDLPLVQGIAQSVAECKSRGIEPVLASCAWTVVSESLAQRFGFEAWCGPELAVKDGVFIGKTAAYADEQTKVTFMRQQCECLGVEASNCIAIGDSRSDLPLFKAVGVSLAFNADKQTRAAATFAFEGADLSTALARLFEHLPVES